MPTHLQVSLRVQSIQKGKHHNLSKDTVVQLGKGPAPAITGLCRLRREHRNEPEALATQLVLGQPEGPYGESPDSLRDLMVSPRTAWGAVR